MTTPNQEKFISRREAACQILAGTTGLVLGSQFDLAGFAAEPKPGPKSKAKSVIQIWMWGGPSHLDTFDPKPDAGNDYCGPLNKPIARTSTASGSANCCRYWPSRPTSIRSSAA